MVFLERSSQPEFTLTPMPAKHAAARFEMDFLADTPEALEPQFGMVRRLVERGCWHLRYGEPPDAVARRLAGVLA